MKKKYVVQIRSMIFLSLIASVIILNAQEIEFFQNEVTVSFTDGFDVSSADINQDGHPDILACGKANGGEVTWWRNLGDNTFTKISLKQNFIGARSIRAADLNGDQEIDIVCAAWQANKIVYFENDGDESFTENIIDSYFKGAHTIDLKDINGDSHIDILCSGYDYYGHQGEIAWWENSGEIPIIWTKHLISDRFQQSPFIYGEDLDNDGDIDVVACGELNDEVLWWENDGFGEFISENMIDADLDGAHTVIAKDVDMDGDADILGAAWNSGKLIWYENTEDHDFIKHDLTGVSGALWLDAADLDHDNDMDLIAAGQNTSTLYWYENNGEETFTRYPVDGNFPSGFCVVPIDMDDDTDIDLIAIGKASDKISWFENNLINNETVTDYDGNVYNTVAIGDQVWLKENLESTHYSDGTEITEVWAYNDDEGLVSTYGRLYTWDGAMNYSTTEAAQGACPNGWHIPTDAEWTELGTFLGGDAVAGGKLKESGTVHWKTPNAGATNESGYTVLPAGEYDDTHYQLLEEFAVIWSSTQTSATKCKYRYLAYNDAELHTYNFYKNYRYSIRCIKNETVGFLEQEDKEKTLVLYPNPANNNISVQFLNQLKMPIEIKVLDISGRMLERVTLTSMKNDIDISYLQNGFYFMVLENERTSVTTKFVKY